MTSFPDVGLDEIVQFLGLHVPNISHPYTFLWGYVKSRENANEVQNVEELKRRVRLVIGSIILRNYGVRMNSDFKLCMPTTENTGKWFSFLMKLLEVLE